MPFRVRVRNFQSLGDVTVEVDGLTVLTGPNNSGKTALIRAIFGAFTNARGTDFVRRGKESAIVEVTFPDGRSLVWEKGKKINRYELDGRVMEGVGLGAPEDVRSLGVGPIEAAGRELWPQFAHQFVGQVFLLDQPGSVLAEAIANVDKVGVLNEALRLSQVDRRTAVSDLKSRKEEASRWEAELRRFDGFEEVVERIRKVEELERKGLRIQKALEEVRSLQKRWGEASVEVQRLLPIREVPTGDLGSARSLREQGLFLSEVKALGGRLEAAKALVSKLVPVRDITLGDEALVSRVKKTGAALDWVRDTESRLKRAREERDRAEDALTKVKDQPLPDPTPVQEAWAKLGEVKSLYVKWKSAREAVEALRVQLGNTRQEHDRAVSAVTELLKESGSCPFCGVTHEDSSC